MPGDEFHVEAPRKKHEENSPQGDREAMRRGFEGTDHDEQKGKSGISYNTHWKHPMLRDGFKDPLGKIDPDTPFDELSDEEIQRLVAHTGDEVYHIRSTAAGIRHAARVGLEYVQVECKPGNRWTYADVRHWKKIAKEEGIRLVVKTMDNWAGWKSVRNACMLAGVSFRRIRMGRS